MVRTPNSQSREPDPNSFAAVSNLGQFVSLHFASLHSTIFLNEYPAIDSGEHI